MPKIIETPVGKNKVELKDFITGRESRVLRESLIKSATIDPEGKGVTKIDPSALNKSDDDKITLVVVSVDGKKEGILNTVLDMPKEDYEFVMDAIEEVTDGLSKKNEDS